MAGNTIWESILKAFSSCHFAVLINRFRLKTSAEVWCTVRLRRDHILGSYCQATLTPNQGVQSQPVSPAEGSHAHIDF